MKQKSGPDKAPAEQVLKNIRRQTRRKYSAEEKIRIVLEGLRGEENISELCRREGIAASMYYGWSKEFLEAGKRRLAGDTARAATSDEVKDLRLILQGLAFPSSRICPWVSTIWSSLQISFCTRPRRASLTGPSHRYRCCSRRAAAVARTGRPTCTSSPPT
jgi:transposase